MKSGYSLRFGQLCSEHIDENTLCRIYFCVSVSHVSMLKEIFFYNFSRFPFLLLLRVTERPLKGFGNIPHTLQSVMTDSPLFPLFGFISHSIQCVLKRDLKGVKELISFFLSWLLRHSDLLCGQYLKSQTD